MKVPSQYNQKFTGHQGRNTMENYKMSDSYKFSGATDEKLNIIQVRDLYQKEQKDNTIGKGENVFNPSILIKGCLKIITKDFKRVIIKVL